MAALSILLNYAETKVCITANVKPSVSSDYTKPLGAADSVRRLQMQPPDSYSVFTDKWSMCINADSYKVESPSDESRWVVDAHVFQLCMEPKSCTNVMVITWKQITTFFIQVS